MRPEESFQSDLIALARSLGWRVAHFRPVRTGLKNGAMRWLTPVQGDGEGFPDLVLVRERYGEPRVLWVELKTNDGVISLQQERWLAALRAAGQRAYVWHLPRDLDVAVAVLRALS